MAFVEDTGLIRDMLERGNDKKGRYTTYIPIDVLEEFTVLLISLCNGICGDEYLPGVVDQSTSQCIPGPDAVLLGPVVCFNGNFRGKLPELSKPVLKG